MKQLLIATQNRGKFDEFFGILKNLPFRFLALDDLEPKLIKDLSIEEKGKTFKENAILKAKNYGQASGLLTLADDSGLCVDYLNGRPGVNSHRYLDGSDEGRYQKLLKEMIAVPWKQRTAKFICAIALFDPKTNIMKTTHGECKGRITMKPKGKYGFGFDPIFVADGLAKHFAELSLPEKNKISHRAKALVKMKNWLASLENEH